MEQVAPTKLLFSTTTRDFANDKSVAEVINARDLTSTSMYTSQGTCNRCYPITNHCRGHIGKLFLTSYHVKYVYKSIASKLCRLICDTCYYPIDDSSSSLTMRDVRLLATLYSVYNNRCNCTGSKNSDAKPSDVEKLQSVYTHIESTNQLDILQQIFMLDSRRQVLVNYILVLPMRLLEQIPNGSEILSLYRKLLEYSKSFSVGLQNATVKSIYKAYAKTLDGKPGLMRQYVLPRKVPNSARAVIVSDIRLSISEVGIPKFMSRAIYSDVLVTEQNIWNTVVSVTQGIVSGITYDKRRYKLISDNVYIRLALCTYDGTFTSGIHSKCLLIGSKMFMDNGGKIIFNGNNHEQVAQCVSNCHTIVEPDGKHLYVMEPKTYTLLIDTCTNYDNYYSCQVSLQVGCIVSTPMESQRILMHRNPVLSAGSMRVHHMRLIDNPRDICMTHEEKHLQRLQLINRRHKTLLGMDESQLPVNPDEDTILGRRTTEDVLSSVVKYSVTSREVHCVTESRNTNCCISLNPLVVATYQGDFDGDEMNAFSLNHCDVGKTDMSVVGDLRKGSFGPTHDAMYGLYCLIHGKVDRGYVCGSVREYAKDAPTVHLVTSAKSVVKFLVSLMEYKDKVKIRDNFSYNNYFCDYLSDETVLTCLKRDYHCVDSENLAATFYTDIGVALCDICNHCGMYFDVYNRDSIEDIIESKCKPKSSTRDGIYDKIGNISYLLPTGSKTSYIYSNYSKGVSMNDYIELCYANRLQVVNKATATAPEGENMRMQCAYMSSLTNKGEIWYTREDAISSLYKDPHDDMLHKALPICEVLTEQSIASSSEEDYLSMPITYRDIIDHNCYRLPYRSLDELPRHMVEDRERLIHMGQRKLLMSEIDFLTDYSNSSGCTVVYAGAASGTHISTLLKLFPEIKFDLYDTSEFSSTLYNKVTNKPRTGLTMYKEYLTPEISYARYSNMNNVLFISDIRTNSRSPNKPSDSDIASNNSTNLEILKAMNPVALMLKFRLPYTDGTTTLPLGEIRLQCWPGIESTETRLVCKAPYQMVEYSNRAHEQVMYCHNLTRPYEIYGKEVSPYLELNIKKLSKRRYYDMYRETQIIYKYVNARRVPESYVYDCINDVIGSITSYVNA